MPTTACKHHKAARRRRLCVYASLVLLLLLAAAVAALAITALRPHPADTTISAIRLTSVSLSPGSLSLNVTLDAVLSIRNPSPVASFAHGTGLAQVYYRGALAADADVPPGRVGAGGAETVAVRITVLADRIASYAPQMYGDVVGGAGDVPLTVRTTVPGTVTVLGLLRHHADVITVCDVTVSVRRAGEQSSSCRYRTKF